MAMTSASSNDFIDGFNRPFVAPANYLGMNYLGDIHTWAETDNISNEAKNIINDFIENILHCIISTNGTAI